MTAKTVYRIPLTKKQQREVRRIYQAECLLTGVEIGALVGQPVTDDDTNQLPESRGMLVIRFYTSVEVKGMADGYRAARKES